jgi:DNA-binding response OmpR family regulator
MVTLTFNMEFRTVTRNGVTVRLSCKRFRLFARLARGGRISRDDLMRAVYCNPDEEPQCPTALDGIMRDLRKAIKPLGLRIAGQNHVVPGWELRAIETRGVG